MFAQESKTLKDSGLSSKIMPSCKWPIIIRPKGKNDFQDSRT